MNWGKLVSCLSWSVDEAFTYMQEVLVGYGYQLQVSPDRHWIWADHPKRTSNVCLVAHLDTISRKSLTLGRRGTQVYNQDKCVLGADDRAGVYAIWEVLENGYRPFVLFTTGEEAMGIGVRDCIRVGVIKPWLDQIDLFIELDRQGVDEYVYYSDEIPPELHQWARNYGLREEYGSYSDVADLTRAYTIGHLNVSVGYQHQHTPSETLDMVALDAAMLRTCWMLADGHAPRVRLTDDQLYGKPIQLGKYGNYGSRYGKSKPRYTHTVDEFLWDDNEAAYQALDTEPCEFCESILHTATDCAELEAWLK